MTLIAAFRSRKGGVLLCADREEGDGYAKRSVNKISEIPLQHCKVFIAGAGSSAVIRKVSIQIQESLQEAENSGANLINEHQPIIEGCLESVYERYVKSSDDSIGLLIVVAFYNFGNPNPSPPRLYKTEGAMLLPENLYAAQGTGKLIADYLADRLYKHGMDALSVTLLAAFIFRETGNASSGVGLGTDMVMVFEEGRGLRFIGGDAVRELEAGIPALRDSIIEHWGKHATIPEWLLDKERENVESRTEDSA